MNAKLFFKGCGLVCTLITSAFGLHDLWKANCSGTSDISEPETFKEDV